MNHAPVAEVGRGPRDLEEAPAPCIPVAERLQHGEGGRERACFGRVGYSAGPICTGITRGLTSVVRVKASAIAATSAPSSGSC
jgi:hypothetical protein